MGFRALRACHAEASLTHLLTHNLPPCWPSAFDASGAAPASACPSKCPSVRVSVSSAAAADQLAPIPQASHLRSSSQITRPIRRHAGSRAVSTSIFWVKSDGSKIYNTIQYNTIQLHLQKYKINGLSSPLTKMSRPRRGPENRACGQKFECFFKMV